MKRPSLLIASITAVVFASCSTEPVVETVVHQLTLGYRSEIATATVPVGGGTLQGSVDSSGGTNIMVTVPAGSFAAPQAIRLSRYAITGHNFGDILHPLTELLEIDFGDTYPAHNLLVDILTPTPKNSFVMAFYYDQETKELEAIPLCTPDKDGAIRFALRHSGDFFLSSISLDKLTGTFDSKFSPTLDISSMPNIPTTTTPQGEFAGLTLGNLFYFCQPGKRGSSRLASASNSDWDASGSFWFDNRAEIALATSAENDLRWTLKANSIHEELFNADAGITLKQLQYAMLVTGKPQLLSIQDPARSGYLPLVAYKVVAGKVYLSDPTGPLGAERSIDLLQTGVPWYKTQLHVPVGTQVPIKSYNTFTFLAGKALIEWSLLGSIWDSSAKAANPLDTLPTPMSVHDTLGTISVKNGAYFSLANEVHLGGTGLLLSIVDGGKIRPYNDQSGIVLSADSQSVAVMYSAPQTNGDTLWGGFSLLHLRHRAFVFSADTVTTYVDQPVTIRTVSLIGPSFNVEFDWQMGDGLTIKKVGEDTISHAYGNDGIFPVTLSVIDRSNGRTLGRSTCFVRVRLNPVAILPWQVTVMRGSSHWFYAAPQIPKNIVPRFEWDPGDGSAKTTIAAADSIALTYTTTGSYLMHVSVYDNATGALLGIGEANVVCKTAGFPTLEQLHSMSHLDVWFAGNNIYSNYSYDENGPHTSTATSSLSIQPTLTSSDPTLLLIAWDGNDFSLTYSYHNETHDSAIPGYETSNSHTNIVNTVSGTISSDCATVNLRANYSDHYDYWQAYLPTQRQQYGDQTSVRTIECSSLPFAEWTDSTIVFQLSGPQLQTLINTLSNNWDRHDPTAHPSLESEYRSTYAFTNWDDPVVIPVLTVRFRK